ncbi:hypothetical protein [Agromyces sp. Marseille-Q5079]|uniref:hypothetical protein n=1 Tax=Agromyces sp. Marseille-Q5079 TaxID=3439059 RepID=UPI003D9CBB31
MAADASGPEPFPEATGEAGPARPLTDAQKALRAQMLATEHWSLLASRSTTQSEVLTRIAIFLTLVSAGLVTLGVLGNATAFRGWFGVAALGVLFLLVILGLITQLRVFNTATEDLVYVLAMNRLRAAYVDLDPGIEPYIMMGTADDAAGVDRTYYAYAVRSRSQVLGSSMMLILVVHSALVGLFVGALAYAIVGSVDLAILVGSVLVLVAFALWMVWGYHGYRQVLRLHEPLRRTGGSGAEHGS